MRRHDALREAAATEAARRPAQRSVRQNIALVICRAHNSGGRATPVSDLGDL